ncbi:trypsin-like peptidase domain-containing protein [Desmonostoc muscorum CCALA 125]|nr:trypsin-like peptidase domain-containing protein [Desmonostoc muscorum CCALA 125]
MMLIVAITFIGSSCEGKKTPIPDLTPTISIPSPTPTIPNPTPIIPSPTPTTSGLIPEEIRKLAEETTVFITGRGKPGSGVIIDREDNTNTYYVLTAAHVVGSKPTPFDPPYKLQTKDNQERIVADDKTYDENVQKFRESTDLAIIKFTAEPGQEYQFAPLAKSILIGMPVYGFGWTSCSGGNQRQFQKTEGEICKINPDANNGWNVSYTNNIIEGMSGGPVFDSSGYVVAIQAGQDGNGAISDDSCKPLPLQPDPKFNYGLGVPIRENFEMLRAKLGQKLEIKLQPAISPQQEPIVNIKCREKLPQTECPPILAPGESCNSHFE